MVKFDQFKIRQIWLRPVSSGKHENIFKQSLREKNFCLFCSEIIALSSVLMSFKLETSGKQKHSFFIQDDSTDTFAFEAFDWEWSDKERLLLILFFYCRRRRLKMLLLWELLIHSELFCFFLLKGQWQICIKISSLLFISLISFIWRETISGLSKFIYFSYYSIQAKFKSQLVKYVNIVSHSYSVN